MWSWWKHKRNAEHMRYTVADTGTKRSFFDQEEDMYNKTPLRGVAMSANDTTIEYKSEGYKPIYLPNDQGELILAIVRGTYSDDCARGRTLLATNSIEELGSAEEPYWTSFCRYRGSYIHMGEYGKVKLIDRNGIRLVPDLGRPAGMTHRQEERVVRRMLARGERVAILTRCSHALSATDETLMRISTNNQGEVHVTMQPKKSGPKKRRGTDGARKDRPRDPVAPEAIIAMLGHISPKAAVRTLNATVGNLRDRVDLDKLSAFEPTFPFSLAATQKNLTHSANDFSHFRGRGDVLGDLTLSDSKPKVIPSVRAYVGFAVAVDAKSSYCTLRLFRTKRDAEEVIPIHHNSAQAYGHVLRYWRADAGTEVANKSCEHKLNEREIVLEVASTNAPNQIAKAEKRIGMIMRTAVALLSHAALPWQAWCYAVQTANHLINCTVQKGETQSPYEQWRVGEKPIFHTERIFGERHVLKNARTHSGNAVDNNTIGYYLGQDTRQVNHKLFMVPCKPTPTASGSPRRWRTVSTGDFKRLDSLQQRREKTPPEMQVLVTSDARKAMTNAIKDLGITLPPTPDQGEDEPQAAPKDDQTSAAANQSAQTTDKPVEKRVSFADTDPVIADWRYSTRRSFRRRSRGKRRRLLHVTAVHDPVCHDTVDQQVARDQLRRRSARVQKRRERRLPESVECARREVTRRRSQRLRGLRERALGVHSAETTTDQPKRKLVTIDSNDFRNREGRIVWRKVRKAINKYADRDVSLLWDECYAVRGGKTDAPKRSEWIGTDDEPMFLEAEGKELKSQIECGAWTIVPRSKVPKGTSVMRSGWTYLKKRDKHTGEVLRWKARFYVCGFSQKKDVHFDKTYSPTAKAESIRLVMAMAAGKRWKLRMADVSTAYLQSDLMFQNLFAMMPEAYRLVDRNGKPLVLHLRRPVYGAKQSGRRWWLKLDRWMKDHGFVANDVDPCVYQREGMIVACYVDDLTAAVADKETWNEFIEEFTDVKNGGFKARDEGKPTQVLGGAVTYHRNGSITWSHEKLIEKTINLVQEHTNRILYTKKSPGIKGKYIVPPDAELRVFDDVQEEIDQFPYRQVTGQLCYLATMSRPDIAFDVSQVARYNDNPHIDAIEAIRQIAEYLNFTRERGVTYGGDPTMTAPVCFADAAHASDPVKGYGVKGHVVMLYGGPVAWKSKSIKIIVRGTRDSECLALCDGVEGLLWTREWLDSFGILRSKDASRVYCDNSALVTGMGDGSFKSSRKAVIQAGRLIRYEIEAGRIEVWHLRGEDNVSDLFTKSETGIRLKRLSRVFMGETPVHTVLASAGVLCKATAKDYR